MASGFKHGTKVSFLGPSAQAYFDELKILEKEHLEELIRLKEQQWAKVHEKQDLVDSLFNTELYNSLEGISRPQNEKDEPPTLPKEIEKTVHHFRNDRDQVKHFLYPDKKEYESDRQKLDYNTRVERGGILKDGGDNNKSEKLGNTQMLGKTSKVVRIVEPAKEIIRHDYFSEDDNQLIGPKYSTLTKDSRNEEIMSNDKMASSSFVKNRTMTRLKNIVEEQLESLELDPPPKEKENNMNKSNMAGPIKRPFLKKGSGHKRFLPKPISQVKLNFRKTKEPSNKSGTAPVLQITSNMKKSDFEPVIVKHFPDNDKIDTHFEDDKETPIHSVGNKKTPVHSEEDKEKDILISAPSNLININVASSAMTDTISSASDTCKKTAVSEKDEKSSQTTIFLSNFPSAKATAIVNKEKNQKSSVASLLGNSDTENENFFEKLFPVEDVSSLRDKNVPAIKEKQQKEANDLLQYEILEDIVQTSINSDASLITDILHAEEKTQKPARGSTEGKDDLSNPSTSKHSNEDMVRFITYKADLEERKKALLKQMKQCDEKIKQFQTTSVTEFLANVSSSSEDELQLISPIQDSSAPISSNVGYPKFNKKQLFTGKDVVDEVSKKQEIRSSSAVSLESGDTVPVSASVSLLREKLQELNKEIEIYKSQNAMIEKLKMLHENELKKLEKDKKDFTIFKANEIVKLENEIKEKKSHIMREKQIFEKYQKLKKELPGKKEKEEYDALKKKYELLQDEIKKKSIKSNAEIKRLRQLLDVNEKELNNLKAQNKILQIRIDNMTTENVKQISVPKMTKKCSRRNDGMPKTSQDDTESRTSTESCFSTNSDVLKSEFFPLKENVFQTLTSSFDMDSIPDVDDIHKVRFNLDPDVKTFSKSSSNTEYKEIKNNNHVERIFNDGHKEILYFNGSQKYISPDGSYTKTKYFNEDTEEMYPDKHSVYTFASGYKQTFYPDGLKVYENPNMFVEKRFPNGVRQVIFKDNTIVIHRPDGSVERQNPNGGSRVVFKDGTEVIRYPSGEVEIRTSDYIRHEFTDGTVKTIYKSGKCETNYCNGRIKIRDKEGNVIFDDIVP